MNIKILFLEIAKVLRTDFENALTELTKKDPDFVSRITKAMEIVMQSNINFNAGSLSLKYGESDGAALCYIIDSAYTVVPRAGQTFTYADKLSQCVDRIITQGVRYTSQQEIDEALHRMQAAMRLKAEIDREFRPVYVRR